MKKRITTAFALLASLGVLASCQPGGTSSGGTGNNDPTKSYTYNTYLETNPKTWNVHNWQTNDEAYINSFTEIGLYDVILNQTKDGYEFMPEMASGLPVEMADPSINLTADELDAYYGDNNPATGMVWDIPLNQSAKWEDGQAIKAVDYVESMKRLLDPALVNYRADGYYNGNMVIANAETYYKQGRTTVEPAYDYINLTTGQLDSQAGQDGKWYINLGKYTPYVASVFSNADDTMTFYTVLNNRSQKESDAVELAAKRITTSVAYYFLHCVDREDGKYSAFFNNNKADWEKAETPSDVTQTMLENHPDIDISDFDYVEVKVPSSLDSSELNDTYSSAELKQDLQTFVSALGRGSGAATKEFAWELPLFCSVYNDDEMVWENVGIRAVDDYTIRLYLSKEITELNLKFALSSNWLVRTDLYDSLTQSTGASSKATRYATSSVDNYMSYGPYKLTAYESGKTITIERNDQWYGYTDGKHNGQFQMTKINTRIITDHNTAMTLFKQGQLDDITLNATDMKEFGSSSRRTTTYESYTQKITFNTDWSKLLQRQSGNGVNKTVLSNINFRKGLSLGIDRNNLAATTTAGSKAFTGLLNDLYLADVENGTSFRSTKQGKSVYNAVYGTLGGDGQSNTPLAENLNGYNATAALHYAALGIQEELGSTREGHLQKGDKIEIELRVYDSESETTVALRNFLNNAFVNVINAVNEELGLTGRDALSINLSLQKDENYYETAKQGNFDMIFSIWGGAAIDPYHMMQVYCDSTYDSCCEYGFKGKQDETFIGIDANGDGKIDATDNNGDGVYDAGTEWKSFNDWYTEMADTLTGEEDTERRLNILAGLEAGIVNRFEAIPLVARGTSSLTSFKVENATDVYVSMVGYGGIRFMTFNYNDADWAAFVKEQGTNLENLYKA